MVQMTREIGGPVSSKNNVPNYFRGKLKYIDTQINCIFCETSLKGFEDVVDLLLHIIRTYIIIRQKMGSHA